MNGILATTSGHTLSESLVILHFNMICFPLAVSCGSARSWGSLIPHGLALLTTYPCSRLHLPPTKLPPDPSNPAWSDLPEFVDQHSEPEVLRPSIFLSDER